MLVCVQAIHNHSANLYLHSLLDILSHSPVTPSPSQPPILIVFLYLYCRHKEQRRSRRMHRGDLPQRHRRVLEPPRGRRKGNQNPYPGWRAMLACFLLRPARFELLIFFRLYFSAMVSCLLIRYAYLFSIYLSS